MPFKPDGFSGITPVLTIDGARDAIALYQEAFGAELLHCFEESDHGMVQEALIQISGSRLFIQDVKSGHPSPDVVGSPVSFYVYVPDVDDSFDQALDAGLIAVSAPDTMYWGDRIGQVRDPYGYLWSLATHVEDVAEEAIAEAVRANPSM